MRTPRTPKKIGGEPATAEPRNIAIFSSSRRPMEFGSSDESQEQADRMTPGTSLRIDHSPPPMARVLVFDTRPIRLIATAGVLDSQGYECICAGALSAANIALKDGSFDLIVADVGDDAPEVLLWVERLRQAAPHQDVPVVLIAGQQWAGLHMHCDSYTAATPVLYEPIDPSVLLAVAAQKDRKSVV